MGRRAVQRYGVLMLRRTHVPLIILALLVAIGGMGCASSELRGRREGIAQVIEKARKQGAYRCAPRDLALAEAHWDFAGQEMAEGSAVRAADELDLAGKHANEALRLSPRGRCASATETPAPGNRRDRDNDGLFDDEDECPLEAEDFDGYRDDDGCPDRDNDNDGIQDRKDKCPNAAEDKDGVDDEDGCPDDDNDSDGVPDDKDKCPTQAEDRDGFEDEDGCPDNDNDNDGISDFPKADDKCPNDPGPAPRGCPSEYKFIVVTDKKIELRQTVYFATAKTTIRPVSFPLLDEVAAALAENEKIQIRIEGHTDSQGADARNRKLSQGRAESVKQYLVKRGIASGRLTARGYGEEVPIADNRTAAGREQNRRVEFVILEQ